MGSPPKGVENEEVDLKGSLTVDELPKGVEVPPKGVAAED